MAHSNAIKRYRQELVDEYTPIGAVDTPIFSVIVGTCVNVEYSKSGTATVSGCFRRYCNYVYGNTGAGP